eukprot:3758184-Rhodomonas_salina.3
MASNDEESEVSSLSPYALLCDVRYGDTVWSYLPTCCYAKPGTAIASVAVWHCNSACCYLPTRLLPYVRYWPSIYPYAMSGTERAYAATSRPRFSRGGSRRFPTKRGQLAYLPTGCYPMSGTDLAYGARRKGHLTYQPTRSLVPI